MAAKSKNKIEEPMPPPAAAPEADPLAESRRVLAQYEADGLWTMNGKPVDPDDPKVYFQHTDQFISQENIRKNRVGGPTIKLVDRFEMKLKAREAVGRGTLQPWEAPDPLKEANESVPRPGFVRRMLSPAVIKRRGMRGFEIVKDPKNSDVISVGDMPMGEMPISRAEIRNAHYREEGNKAIRDAEAHCKEQQEKLIRDGNAVGIKPLKPGETVRDRNDGSKIAISGLRSHTGNSHFVEE